ncbi:MAG: SAM-dependent chlorinase/fluorinase [Bacteroidota bacterium]
MAIIHLISDFQSGSFKIGLLQSRLKQALKGIDIIDVTHDIKPQNIVEASFVLKHLSSEGHTPVITVVSMGEEERQIIYQHDLQWYILPDNGLLTLVFENPDKNTTFAIKTGELTDALQAIAAGNTANLQPAGNIVMRYAKKPMFHDHMIVTERIYTDKLGNCYFNLTRQAFEDFFEINRFRAKIQYVPGTFFYKISHKLSDVEQGDSMLSFSKNGFLKLSINQGSAAQLFRIKENTQIIIEKI